MSFLKPKAATSTSENKAFGQISSAYSPTIATGNKSTNFLADLLGVNGGGSADDAFSAYKDRAGFAPALSAMQKGVTQGAAARGMLNSGSTQKALLKGGADINSSMFNNFMQQLAGLSGIGLQGGSLVSNAGQTSSSQGGGPSTAGAIASTIGGIASIFSDRRLKRNIVRRDTFPDGLGLYTFKYHGDDVTRVGVMADEVEKLRPWAMGEPVGGYATVNYGELANAAYFATGEL